MTSDPTEHRPHGTLPEEQHLAEQLFDDALYKNYVIIITSLTMNKKYVLLTIKHSRHFISFGYLL